MLNRAGEYISYPGCTEVVKGVFISEEGDVYIHDGESEVACWVTTEFEEDATALVAALFAVVLATKQGPSAVRRDIADRGTTLNSLIKQTAHAQGQ